VLEAYGLEAAPVGDHRVFFILARSGEDDRVKELGPPGRSMASFTNILSLQLAATLLSPIGAETFSSVTSASPR
jgi:hypothetical protein